MKPSETQDLYARLGVAKDASPEEIRSAYRSKARENHPDTNPVSPQEAHENFIAVSEAFEVLSDEEKKS